MKSKLFIKSQGSLMTTQKIERLNKLKTIIDGLKKDLLSTQKKNNGTALSLF
jgi:hypothetical protein